MGLGSGSALSQIAHPRRNQDVGDFYPARVTIEAASQTQAADGSITRTWAVAVDLADLPGNVTLDRSTESDQVRYTELSTRRIVDLNGLYTGIMETMRARVVQSGVETIYNITAVGHDSLNKMTKLAVEIVSH